MRRIPSTGDTRAARRAGKNVAHMEMPRPASTPKRKRDGRDAQRRHVRKEQLLHRSHQGPGSRQSHGQPQQRADGAQQQTFPEQQLRDLAAHGADGTQDTQLAAALGDVHQKRVEDDEPRGQQRVRAADVQPQLRRQHPVLHHLRADLGAAYDHARRQQRNHGVLHVGLIDALFQQHVQGIDAVPQAEQLLRPLQPQPDGPTLDGRRHASRRDQAGDLQSPHAAAGEDLDHIARLDARPAHEVRVQHGAVFLLQRLALDMIEIVNHGVTPRIDAQNGRIDPQLAEVQRRGTLHERRGGPHAGELLDRLAQRLRARAAALGDNLHRRAAGHRRVHVAIRLVRGVGGRRHRHDAGHAYHHAEHGEQGPARAHPYLPQAEQTQQAGCCAKGAHIAARRMGVILAGSSRPSRTWTMLSACAATCPSCVTITIVCRRSRTSRRSRSTTCWPASLSRLPVGSSASSKAGWITKAPCHRHALLLAAGQLTGQVRLTMLHVHQRQRGRPALAGFAWRDAIQQQRQRHVLGRRERGEQVEVLKHKAHAAAADQCPLVVVQLRQVPAFQQDLPAGGLFHARQQVQQRALAGAGGSHDGQELALMHGQIDAAQRLDPRVPLSVGLRQLAGFQNTTHQIWSAAISHRFGFGSRRGDPPIRP